MARSRGSASSGPDAAAAPGEASRDGAPLPGRLRRSPGPTPSRRQALLACGILSSLLYLVMMLAVRYDGYSARAHTVSELAAVGAPTRTLWTILASLHAVLLAAFGAGVWEVADAQQRALRATGVLLLACALLGMLWPFAAMHPRAVLAAGGWGPSDTRHLALVIVSLLVTIAAILLSAAARGPRFRRFALATLAVLLAAAAMTAKERARINADLPTPWVGAWERVGIAAVLVWVAVLALMLLRTPLASARGSSGP